MIYLTSCRDYLRVIGTATTVGEAVRLCRELELATNDGYAVCAWRGSRLVADAEGPVNSPGMSAYERLEASGDAF